jgi:multisubunit Na+/H+ antiporter MnhB subunit
MTRALGRLAARQSRSTTHVLSHHTTETQYMTPFNEMTWTAYPADLATTQIAQKDTRPQSTLGLTSLSLGITSWMVVLLFFVGVRSPYGGYTMLGSTGGAILLGALGMAPAVTGRGVRRGAAIAGFVLGVGVLAGLMALFALMLFLFSWGGAQLG